MTGSLRDTPALSEPLATRRLQEGLKLASRRQVDEKARAKRLADLALLCDQQDKLNRDARRAKKQRKRNGEKAAWAPKHRFVSRFVDDSLDLVLALLDQPNPIASVAEALDRVACLPLDPEPHEAFVVMYLLHQAARQQTPMSDALLKELRKVAYDNEDDWTRDEINSCMRINTLRLRQGKKPIKGEVILQKLRTGEPKRFTDEHICTVMK